MKSHEGINAKGKKRKRKDGLTVFARNMHYTTYACFVITNIILLLTHPAVPPGVSCRRPQLKDARSNLSSN